MTFAVRPIGRRAWTPADLTVPPKIWVDWDSPVSNVGGYASEWVNDRGSLGGRFAQPTAAARPQIVTSAQNGRRAMEFDGLNDVLLASSELLSFRQNTGAVWAMAVAAQKAATGARQVFEASNGTNLVTGFALDAGFNATSWLTGGRASATTPFFGLYSTTAGPDIGFHCVYGHMHHSAGSALLSFDARVDAASSAYAPGLTEDAPSLRMAIGGDASGGGFGNTRVAAVIAGSGTLPSTDERQRLEGWAAHACGLTANLPSDHPYKHAPP